MRIPILCVGSLNLDRYPNIDPPREFLGGSAANTYYYLRQLCKIIPAEHTIIPKLISAVGSDTTAQKILQLVGAKGYDRGYLYRSQGKSTATEITLKTGERDIVRDLEGSVHLAELLKQYKDDLNWSAYKVHIKHNFATLKTLLGFGAQIYAIDISGLTQDPEFMNLKTPPFLGLLPSYQTSSSVRFHIILGNEGEISRFLVRCGLIKSPQQYLNGNKVNQIQLCRRLLDLFKSQYVFMKKGAKGAWGISKSEFYEFPPPPLGKLVDTTGAGDAFNAGVIFAALNEYPLDQCLGLGLKAGSLKCQFLGAQEAVFEGAAFFSN